MNNRKSEMINVRIVRTVQYLYMFIISSEVRPNQNRNYTFIKLSCQKMLDYKNILLIYFI
jgi:hypothetical protein